MMIQEIQDHPIAAIFPLMAESELRDLADDIKANGLQQPLWLYEGKILDGRNRYRACKLAGIEPGVFRNYQDSSPVAFVISLNEKRRHMTSSQRAAVAVESLPWLEREAKKTQGKRSDLEWFTCKKCGEQFPQAVWHCDVCLHHHGEDREICNNCYKGKRPKNFPQIIGGSCHDGESSQRAASLLGTNRQYVSDAKAIKQKSPETFEAIRRGEISIPEAKRSVSGPHVANNSGENEWYTPPQFIEAARSAMGGIDLDPASCEFANNNVKAGKFFDLESNGLKQKWSGRVWLNPPYSQPEIAQFSEKVTSEFSESNIKQACVLVNNATETAWFQAMAAIASAICFLRGRVKYLDRTGKPANTPLQGQAVLYFGEAPNRFSKSFGSLGFILERNSR